MDECYASDMRTIQPIPNKEMKKQVNHRSNSCREVTLGADLWTDGLICAFEFVRVHQKVQTAQKVAREVVKKQPSSHDQNSIKNNLCETSHDQNSPSPQAISGRSLCEPISGMESRDGDNGMLDDHNSNQDYHSGYFHGRESLPRCFWMPIGWFRISELVQTVKVDDGWDT